VNQKKIIITYMLSLLTFLNGAFGQYPAPFVSQALQKNSRPVLEEVVPGTIWIDAEDFSDYGGWYHDTQFIHLMGSGYLLAGGTGTPVKDAVTTISVKKPGSYTLWVRSRNWDAGFAPGTFKVQVGEKISGLLGNDPGEEWVWQNGGSYDLTAGETGLRLMDQTGYYGRCDALVLTLDPAFVPPPFEALADARAKYTGLDLQPEIFDGFDVIVIGGGPAGTSAAIAAARHGARTALIQDRPVLGGNSGYEFAVRMNGAGSKNAHMREGGIINEAVMMHAISTSGGFSPAFQQLADAETNLTVFLNMRVDGVLMTSDEVIKGVKAVHTLDGRRFEFYGALFIDCTGDGWVGYYASADFRLGREARSEFNEAVAPELADNITMSACLNSEGGPLLRNTGSPVQFTPKPWAAQLPKGFSRPIAGLGMRYWWIEYPGDTDDLWQAEEARDYLIRISFGYVDFLKNRWPEKLKAEKYDVDNVGVFLGRRESRRLEGDYVLNLNDVLGARWFEDSITHYGWYVDVHHPLGIFSTEGPFECNYRVPMGGGIPFRCLYSKNITNLLMAGRCISVSHYALGTTRIMMTCATTGQAAGTAAAMAAGRGITPRDVGRDHIHELQQRLLRDDQYIPALKNEDPADLARNAVCTASSVQDVWEIDADYYRRPGTLQKGVKTLPLCARWVMCPVGKQQKIGTLNFYVENTQKTDCEVFLNIHASLQFRDFKNIKAAVKIPVTIPANFSGILPVEVNQNIAGKFLVMRFSEKSGSAAKVYWLQSQSNPPQMCSFFSYKGEEVYEDKTLPAFFAQPALQWDYDFSAENVINGLTRCLPDGSVNMWSSDPAQPLPQWVQLAWEKPQEIKEVRLIFDTNLDRWQYVDNPGIPERVSDYELQAWINHSWQTIAAERGNIQRLRIHQLDPVTTDRLRVLVTKTGGDASARIFEIRAY